MNMNQPGSDGELVKASYKTGVYLGRLIDRMDRGAVVEILAVLRHPAQGDLHRPQTTDVRMFHQRKALSYREKALVPPQDVEAYAGPVPDYADSLQRAWQAQRDELTRLQAWAEQALIQLEGLKVEYKLE